MTWRVCGAAILAMALAACGSGPDQTASADQAGSQTASSSAPQPGALQPGAVTLTVGTLTGDAARGQRVFARCAACHSNKAGQNGIGPSLHDVYDNDAAASPGFGYSPALKNSGKHWDGETLFAFLEAPPMAVPGTRMMFVLTDPQDRADVIAYLSSLK